MMFSATILSTAVTVLSIAHLASAHGYVQNLSIAGKTYPGWLPFDSPYTSPATTSIVRKVPDDGPVTDVTSAAMACNQVTNAPAALTADVNAGTDVKITWNRWPDDHKGPITVWMANCGASCTNFNPSTGNVWFKIEEATLGADGLWPTDKLIANGLTWDATIPSGLKAGHYLLRMEILALHSAGAPQFYPSCAQLNVKGSGSSTPSTSSLADLPGAYAKAGNAIYGDIWEQPKTWPLAGPAVVAFATGSSNDTPAPAPASASSPAKTSSTAAAASTPVKASSTKASIHIPIATAPANAAYPTPSVSASASAASPSATPKKCKRSKTSKITKRSPDVIIRPSGPAAMLVQEKKRSEETDEQMLVKRSWASHSKAKRARDVLHN